ncbi:MAG: hypothetical protein M1820_006789 [Bogoriella megaspora]|nr:MAG: hypothetical protein M1820_006789 [Bogoriella megaspora]
MLSAVLIATTVFAVLGSAQTIDPNSVPIGTRDAWCIAQTSSCPLICLQQPGTTAATQSNDCDADSLSYQCVCSNGVSPNTTQYTQTIPYFECTESNNQCVNNCGTDSTCAANCRNDHPCGAQDPYKGNATVSSILSSESVAAATSASAASKSAGQTFSGFGGATATGDSGSGNAAVTGADLSGAFGLGAVALGVFAGIALLL